MHGLKKVILVSGFALNLSAGLAFGQNDNPFLIVTQTKDGPIIKPEDNPSLPKGSLEGEGAAITDALSQSENFGTETELLVSLVGSAKYLRVFDNTVIDRLEAEILAWSKPLPASNVEGNLAGYTALANLRPDDQGYNSKRDSYIEKVAQKRAGVLKRYKTETDYFSGTVWYIHKNTPRYADIRPYVSLYLGKKDGQTPILRFVLHYTTRHGWLFVNSAKANIDGQIVDIPGSEWKRDNDSETWEWIDEFATENYKNIARRIGNSTKTVIRFSGEQNVDDYIVKADDKAALLDGLLAIEVLALQSN